MTNTVSVRAVEGRIARTSARGGFIPSDQYVAVQNSRYIQRLLNVHGDIELEPVTATQPVASAKVPAAKEDK